MYQRKCHLFCPFLNILQLKVRRVRLVSWLSQFFSFGPVVTVGWELSVLLDVILSSWALIIPCSMLSRDSTTFSFMLHSTAFLWSAWKVSMSLPLAIILQLVWYKFMLNIGSLPSYVFWWTFIFVSTIKDWLEHSLDITHLRDVGVIPKDLWSVYFKHSSWHVVVIVSVLLLERNFDVVDTRQLRHVLCLECSSCVQIVTTQLTGGRCLPFITQPFTFPNDQIRLYTSVLVALMVPELSDGPETGSQYSL